ncbi:hypothetical protein ACFCY1_32990, partial [Kitasatospora sp. NPDC056273]
APTPPSHATRPRRSPPPPPWAPARPRPHPGGGGRVHDRAGVVLGTGGVVLRAGPEGARGRRFGVVP